VYIPTNKRASITLPSSPIPQRSTNPEPETRSRSNSIAKRNSIDIQAEEFANNCEKLADRHKTSKIEVILNSLIKVLEILKK